MRTHHAGPPFHILRAASLSTANLTLAAGAHVAGGGQLPAPVILLAVLALTVLAATVATRLRLNLPATITVLGAGQLVLHGLFAVFSPTGSVTGILAGAHGSHDPGAADSLLAAAGQTSAGHLLEPATPAGILMLLAHALATAVCSLLLAKGESALWALAAWLRPLVRLPEAVRPDAGPSLAVPCPRAVIPLRPWRNLRQDSRRGPPSAVVLP